MHAGFLWRKWNDTDSMAPLGVDSGIILKWILKTLDAKAKTDMRQNTENWRAVASTINII
jgi:hypothetical protein